MLTTTRSLCDVHHIRCALTATPRATSIASVPTRQIHSQSPHELNRTRSLRRTAVHSRSKRLTGQEGCSRRNCTSSTSRRQQRRDTPRDRLARYCWFTDPSRALCLKLAGTPHRDAADDRDVRLGPLPAGHPPQRPPARLGRARRTHQDLPRQLGRTRATERNRLTSDHDRALRVIAEIDAATVPSADNEAQA
jgi:hypothetical protein